MDIELIINKRIKIKYISNEHRLLNSIKVYSFHEVRIEDDLL